MSASSRGGVEERTRFGFPRAGDADSIDTRARGTRPYVEGGLRRLAPVNVIAPWSIVKRRLWKMNHPRRTGSRRPRAALPRAPSSPELAADLDVGVAPRIPRVPPDVHGDVHGDRARDLEPDAAASDASVCGRPTTLIVRVARVVGPDAGSAAGRRARARLEPAGHLDAPSAPRTATSPLTAARMPPTETTKNVRWHREVEPRAPRVRSSPSRHVGPPLSRLRVQLRRTSRARCVRDQRARTFS